MKLYLSLGWVPLGNSVRKKQKQGKPWTSKFTFQVPLAWTSPQQVNIQSQVSWGVEPATLSFDPTSPPHDGVVAYF